MYVYCEPQGGINDIFTSITRGLNYCNSNNRTLLVNGKRTIYEVNFADYFSMSNENIIFDTNKINDICSNNNNTIYPDIFNGIMMNVLNGPVLNSEFEFTYTPETNYTYKGVRLGLPENNRPENIIIFSECHGGWGYPLFKQLIFHPNIKDICKERYNRLEKPYLCIQIRNTDYKCDYISYFYNNENEIRSFKNIYIATDDKKALEFYKEKDIFVQNFVTFPKEDSYQSLHVSSIDPNTRFIDLLCDIYIIGMSDKIMSNSIGRFIDLVREINNNKCNFISF